MVEIEAAGEGFGDLGCWLAGMRWGAGRAGEGDRRNEGFTRRGAMNSCFVMSAS